MKEFKDLTRGVNPESPKQGKYLDISRFFTVHPDMQEAYLNYDGTPESFKRVFRKRKEKVKRGERYWNSAHDVEMRERASNNSKRGDFKWPIKRGEPTYEEELANFRKKVKRIWKGK